jgi:5-methylcytosine-specific restriction enzyme B
VRNFFFGIHGSFLEFGFYIGTYGTEARNRFSQNCRRHYSSLIKIAEDFIQNPDLVFGDQTATDQKPSLIDWLKDPAAYDFKITIVISSEEVLAIPEDQLIDYISLVFKQLYPFFILANESDPIPYIRNYLSDEDIDSEQNPMHTMDEVIHACYIDQPLIEKWLRSIKRKKQAVFYGPPGTGKTFIARHLAEHLICGGNGLFKVMQFHPSFSYEDFMEGIRPQTSGEGALTYPTVPGRFVSFCEDAKLLKDTSVLIIDEINRANLSRVFGELMYLLEYRNEVIILPSGKAFMIPDNVIIIGTMNTADRSIALVDHALRRRFAFIPIYPDYEVLQKYFAQTRFEPKGLINVLNKINSGIGDRNYDIGTSYFMRTDIEENMMDIWEMEIEPYLEELFFDDIKKVDGFRWDSVKNEIMK